MLDRRQHYLQVALNSTLGEALDIVSVLPRDPRVIIEVGTPLIKEYGADAIRRVRAALGESGAVSGELSEFQKFGGLTGVLIRGMTRALEQRRRAAQRAENEPDPGRHELYIVADTKCIDRGEREVEIAADGGANAAVVMGSAPIETIGAFIATCDARGLDAFVDMMNVEEPVIVLSQLRKLPRVILLHRGVDETDFNKDKPIPYDKINRIKGTYDVMVGIAGGDTIREVQRAVFNSADIVVVWKEFYAPTSATAQLTQDFLREIK